MLRVRPRTAADEPAVVALLTAAADRVAALEPLARLVRRPQAGGWRPLWTSWERRGR